jgi:hypothetical protein
MAEGTAAGHPRDATVKDQPRVAMVAGTPEDPHKDAMVKGQPRAAMAAGKPEGRPRVAVAAGTTVAGEAKQEKAAKIPVEAAGNRTGKTAKTQAIQVRNVPGRKASGTPPQEATNAGREGHRRITPINRRTGKAIPTHKC